MSAMKKASIDSGRSSSSQHSLTPEMVLERHRDSLSEFETEEIKQFPEVFYFGHSAHKVPASETTERNCGFDDANGHYIFVEHDHVHYRYEMISKLGNGTFGDVYQAIDHKTSAKVAIKMIRNEAKYLKSGQSEIKLLQDLNKAQGVDDAIIQLLDHFVFRNHLCLVFELLHGDLYAALKKTGMKGFEMARIKDLVHGVLKCLVHMHRVNLVHCDLKPENVLLRDSSSNNVKVIDFGLSGHTSERVHSYIQSRYYRAPEVILKHSNGPAMDMWSLGCMVAEFCNGKVLFPGKDEKEQLMYHMELLGRPSDDMLERSAKASTHFVLSTQRCIADRRGKRHPASSRTFADALGADADAALVDFVRRCLTMDPLQRMTAEQAIHHPFIFASSVCSDPTDEGWVFVTA